MGILSCGLCVVYAVAGFAAFVTFLSFDFYSAAIFGSLTAIINTVTAHLIYLHDKNRLNLWYEHHEVANFYYFGLWTLAFGCSGFVYDVVILSYIAKFEMIYVVTTIWSFITAKSGATLIYYSNKYWAEQNQPSLLIVS